MSEATTFRINRSPVLTLWAAVVVERLGFDHNEALTLGRAGLNAHAKGKRLRLFKPSADSLREVQHEQPKVKLHANLLHQAVPVVMTPDGIRATTKSKPANPASDERYLAGRFGEYFEATERAMPFLARSYPPAELADIAFRLYEQFRPIVPAGLKAGEPKTG